ncbi:UBX domain-containing protein 4-like [Lycorma delicatula]|uniref:UBX domain-containing protein 4-like n=1 Tax=Lycorma delicatula TaxID=130591 RepID=UPI003F51148A
MKWFEGSVKEAVAKAKEKNCFLIVYIEGYDKSSETMTSAINSDDISQILEGEHCVNLKLKIGSIEYYQFIDVYKYVPIPSLFFIGANGVPLAVVHNSLDEDVQSVHQQLLQVISRHNVTKSKFNLVPINSNEASVEYSETSYDGSTTSEQSALTRIHEHEAVIESINLQTKISEAKGTENIELSTSKSTQCESNIKIKVNENGVEEQKDEKQLKTHRNKFEEEKKILFDKQHEKSEDEQNRQRILNEIAQDKEERFLRQQETKIINQGIGSEKQINSKTESFTAGDNQTYIQFRKPDGSTHTATFHKESIIDDLRRYVTYNVPLRFKKFDLAVAFPRHVFTDDENNKSLEELNLIPNSVLLILPSGQNYNTMYSSSPTILERVSGACWSLVSPVVYFTTCVQNNITKIFPQRQINSNETQIESQPESSAAACLSPPQDTGSQNKDINFSNVESDANKTTNSVNVNSKDKKTE